MILKLLISLILRTNADGTPHWRRADEEPPR